jgi:signal transduction histidine kinase
VLGAAESGVDGDSVLREAFLRLGNHGGAGSRYPHFALALLQAGGETVHPRTQALADADPGPQIGQLQSGALRSGRFAIRYAGPPGTVDHVSYAEVLAGAVPASRLAGRYVLVGMTAQGLGDTLATPVNSSHLAMPGIEAHANILYTLRSGDSIATLSDAGVAALSAALVGALLLAFGHFGPRVALPLAVSSAPMAVLCSLLALRQGYWVSPAPYALAALLAYPLWSWRRLEAAVKRLDAEIAHLAQADPQAVDSGQPLPGLPRPALRARRGDGDALEARLHILRRAGDVISDARRFLAEALAAMPAAMLVADDQARVVLANPRAAALFEVESSDELMGLDLLRLLGEFTPTAGTLDWAALVAGLQAGGDGLAVEVALEQMAAGTQQRHGAFVVQIAVVELQGQRRLIVNVADVEPVKQAQRDREEVLAFVSHDLRSPAHAIVLLVDLHLQGRMHTAVPELLQEVRRLAGRTLALSEGLVRAAQVQTQALNRAPVTLAELVSDALGDVRAQALAAGIDLREQLAVPSVTLQIDRLMVARAIGNLVSNALKHGPTGSSVLLRAQVHENGPQRRLRLSVRDHGRGLSAQQLEQLARGDEGAAVGDATGVGLGLLFVQRVARRHGGTLQARTPADGGSGVCFEIELPA